jgi:hypothetical protein
MRRFHLVLTVRLGIHIGHGDRRDALLAEGVECRMDVACLKRRPHGTICKDALAHRQMQSAAGQAVRQASISDYRIYGLPDGSPAHRGSPPRTTPAPLEQRIQANGSATEKGANVAQPRFQTNLIDRRKAPCFRSG